MLLKGFVKSNFWEAVKEGNLSKVEEYVNVHHVDVNSRDFLKNTPLHYAVLNQDTALIKFLIKNGAEINAKNAYGKTVLHTVLERDFKSLVGMLLKNGANVNQKKISGERPLDIAIEMGNKEVVKLLLDSGAMTNYSTKDVSPLHRATLTGNVEIVEMLLDYGATITVEDYEGRTPLELARQTNNDEIIKIFERIDYWDAVKEGNIPKIENYMKKSEIDVNAKDVLKNTPLHYAILNQDSDLIKFLIKNGADVNAKNAYGKTVLHTALERKSIHLVELLLRNGANVNLEKFSGERPLDIAVEMKNKDVVGILLKNGALVNHPKEYTSALHRAVGTGNVEIVEMLLEHGAECMQKDKTGKTPLAIAKRKGNTDVYKLMSTYVIPRIAIKDKDTETLRECLKEYNANHERNIYKRMNKYFKIDHYMYLLRNSEQVLELLNNNKQILKSLESIESISKMQQAQEAPAQDVSGVDLKEVKKDLKSELNKNKAVLKVINESQKDVDALFNAQVVDFILQGR